MFRQQFSDQPIKPIGKSSIAVKHGRMNQTARQTQIRTTMPNTYIDNTYTYVRVLACLYNAITEQAIVGPYVE